MYEFSDHDVEVEVSPTSPTIRFKLGDKLLILDLGIAPPRANQRWELEKSGTSLICQKVVRTKYYDSYHLLVAGSRFDAPSGKVAGLEVLLDRGDQLLTLNWPSKEDPESKLGCFDNLALQDVPPPVPSHQSELVDSEFEKIAKEQGTRECSSFEREISQLILDLEVAIAKLRTTQKRLNEPPRVW